MTSTASRTSPTASILVVEDDFLLSSLLRDEIEALGYRVVGPAASVSDALALLEGDVSAALVDIRLGSELATPVAARLVELSIPFAFLSAYRDSRAMGPLAEAAPILGKPLSGPALEAALNELLSSRR